MHWTDSPNLFIYLFIFYKWQSSFMSQSQTGCSVVYQTCPVFVCFFTQPRSHGVRIRTNVPHPNKLSPLFASIAEIRVSQWLNEPTGRPAAVCCISLAYAATRLPSGKLLIVTWAKALHLWLLHAAGVFTCWYDLWDKSEAPLPS